MCKKDICDVVSYLQHMVDVILDLKDELQHEIDKRMNSECSDYEQQLQKLEAEIRNHIRVPLNLRMESAPPDHAHALMHTLALKHTLTHAHMHSCAQAPIWPTSILKGTFE